MWWGCRLCGLWIFLGGFSMLFAKGVRCGYVLKGRKRYFFWKGKGGREIGDGSRKGCIILR